MALIFGVARVLLEFQQLLIFDATCFLIGRHEVLGRRRRFWMDGPSGSRPRSIVAMLRPRRGGGRENMRARNRLLRDCLLVACWVGVVAEPLARAGSLVAWGGDEYGQVSKVPAGVDFTAVAGGRSVGYALGPDGVIAVWGNDERANVPRDGGHTILFGDGERGRAARGDGAIDTWLVGYREGAGEEGNVPGGGGFVALGGSERTGYALRADGSIAAWGDDDGGQVSDAPSESCFIAIAGGCLNGYALRRDGSIVAWGADLEGLVSDAPKGTGFLAIAARGLNAYALRANGSIAAWGDDEHGQVSSVPTETDFTALAAGDGFGYALRADGSIAAWGWDESGQVSKAPAGIGFTAIAAGGATGYALRADGPSAAPEPPALVMAGLAAAILGGLALRRRR